MERPPLDKFHHDELVAVDLAALIVRHDVGMIEGAGGFGLAIEALRHVLLLIGFE